MSPRGPHLACAPPQSQGQSRPRQTEGENTRPCNVHAYDASARWWSASSLVAAACGGDDDDDARRAPAQTTTTEATDTTADGADTTVDSEDTERPTGDDRGHHRHHRGRRRHDRSGGGDAECGKAASDVTDGDLAGFKGTTPFGVITDEFIGRLCEVDPSLEDLNYATETYDAIMITALAVEVAGDDGIAHASEINGVTRDGEMCTTFADCKALIEAGTDIDYDGISGPLTFAGNGEPIVASYGALVMGDNNRIDPSLTEYIEVTGPPEADVPQQFRSRAPAPVTAC